MTSEYLGRAEEISIDCEDTGFVLWFTTEEGTYRVNVQGAASDLLEAVDRTVRPWWQEGESVRRLFEKDMAQAAREVFRCAPEDVDESGGYDISDPKYPAYHSTHADIWDSRAGK